MDFLTNKEVKRAEQLEISKTEQTDITEEEAQKIFDAILELDETKSAKPESDTVSFRGSASASF